MNFQIHVSPRFLMRSNVGFPPLECCLGTNPSLARQLSTTLELHRVADRGDLHAYCDRPDAGVLQQSAARDIVPKTSLNQYF